MYRSKKVNESSVEGAYKTALNILSLADNTIASLTRKLRDRGYMDEDIDGALALLSKEGLVNETRHLMNKARYYADVCLYGKGRIRLELMKKGFARALLDERLDEALDEVDFAANCLRLMKKKRLPLPKTRQEGQKVVAALMRYGYTGREIRQAIEERQRQEENDCD